MRRILSVLCATCAAFVVAGCATDGSRVIGGAATPAYDSKFGDAVRQARALQTINPEAGAHGDPVTGIDARAGASAIERYQDSFRAPPRTFEVLNIGGGGQ